MKQQLSRAFTRRSRAFQTMGLLTDDVLEQSSIVANCRMNRERNLVGSNGYERELGFAPLDFLRQRIHSDRDIAWLDLCCGTGRALIQAARQVRADGLMSRIQVVGVDLAGMFDTADTRLECLRLVEASLRTWRPERSFDLITCVHGLHYLGDKLGLIAGAVSWLVKDGLFVANLDLRNIRVTGDGSNRKLLAGMKHAGFDYNSRKRRVSSPRREQIDLPFLYLGADDQAGPNSTGQPAVNSHYEFDEGLVPPTGLGPSIAHE